jgi:REP element-mobilizing transposase RayT/IS1 family transposase
MPRHARLDAPGVLHHIMIRGIEQRFIFRDDIDRDRFVERMAGLFTDTHTPCYAWALLGNHAHLLLKTGDVPLHTVMARLLTGHAVTFNKRYRRHGQLFQNRYKSILCQEDAYLTQLVCYIHLNPVRAGMVTDLDGLSRYPYSGHSALMGKVRHPWQDDADTKLVPTWHIGSRDLPTATAFMNDLASRLKNRVQLTTDGHKMYLDAVENAFGFEVDFSQLIKLYGSAPDAEVRYSPAECIGTDKKPITGQPDNEHISTSYVERQNLTMRMSMRRFTRLTNAFSKKVENLAHAVALHFMYYNFCRIHQTLRVTPAMAAGVTAHVWDVKDIISLIK